MHCFNTSVIRVIVLLRLRSHRNIRYTVYGIRYTLYGIRYTLFGIRYTLYGHGGSHRSNTCFQCALFVSMKKVTNSVMLKRFLLLLAEEEEEEATIPK